MRPVITLLRFESYDIGPGHYSDTLLRIKIMRLVMLRFESYDIGPGHYSDTLLRIKIMRLVITLLRFERYDIGPGHYSDTLLRIKIFAWSLLCYALSVMILGLATTLIHF